MARAKKSDGKSDAEADKPDAEAVKAEDAPKSGKTVRAEDIQDAVILEDADQDGVPEADVTQDSSIPVTGTPSEQTEAAAVATEPTPAEMPERTGGGGFFSLVLGGAIAAAIGYGVAVYLGDAAWPFANQSSALDELSATVSDQAAEADAMRSEIATLKEEIANAGDGGQEAALQEVEALITRLTDMDQRLTDLENRPVPQAGVGGLAVAAYEEQLAGMRAMFEEELARIRATQADAEAAGQTAAERAEAAAMRAGLAQIQASVDSGAPYVDALGRLNNVGIDVPAGLADSAETGVPTLAGLQRDYPAAARAALNASIKAQSEAGQIDPLTGFLKMQLGTRSLEPREGDDPDAILSRAEAALRDGNLSRSLSELEALSEAGAEAMAGWVAKAQARNDAVTALAALSDQLNN